MFYRIPHTQTHAYYPLVQIHSSPHSVIHSFCTPEGTLKCVCIHSLKLGGKKIILKGSNGRGSSSLNANGKLELIL